MGAYDFTNAKEYKDFKRFVTEKFKEIPQIKTNGGNAYLPWCDWDDDIIILKPRGGSDMEIIHLYCLITTGVPLTNYDYKVPVNYSNKIVIINFFDGDHCKYFIKDELINDINKSYAEFGKQLEEMMKEE